MPANNKKFVFLAFLILFANAAHAYNPSETGEIALVFFLIVGLVVFLFIMATVNYFRKVPEDEPLEAQQEAQQDVAEEEPQEQPQSAFSYVLRKSFVIFVIRIIIGLIIATLNMDA